MTPPRPMHPWAGDLAAVRDGDRASESVLHILLKSLVGGEFRGFGPTRLPVGMPLCDRGSVIQTTAAGCCVPATLPRDHRGVPAQPSGALTGPVFLGRQHGDLLALGKGQVATRRGSRLIGGIPPPSRNHRGPNGIDTPHATATCSLENPSAILRQNSCCSLHRLTGGRPGDRSGGRPARSASHARPCATTTSP